MIFNHLPELLGLLVLGLLIFGPRRMIEAASQLGRMLREAQTALKDMDWGPGAGKAASLFSSSQTPLGRLSQLAQVMTTPAAADAPVNATPGASVVESSPVVESTAQASSELPAE